MKKLLYAFMGTTLIIASCDGRDKNQIMVKMAYQKTIMPVISILPVIVYLLEHPIIQVLKRELTTSQIEMGLSYLILTKLLLPILLEKF